MSKLLERIDAELKQAVRDHLKQRVLVLRGLKSSLHNQEIKLHSQKQELTEEEAIRIIRTEAKKRQEAANLYLEGGREELAQKELGEKAEIEKYLPPPPSLEEIKQVTVRLKQELNLSGVTDVGKLIKALLTQFGSSLDGQTASQVAKEILTD